MDFSTFAPNLVELLKYNPLQPLLFNSGFFLFFFLFILVFYRFFWHNYRAKVFFLMTMSLYFYYKSSGVFFVLIIISSIIDFIAGKMIHENESPAQRKLLLVISLVMNLGILAYFKYTNFFLDTVNQIAGAAHFDMLNIFLPVGVSFFTFQSMSYTIDIYRGQLEPEKKFTDFLFFVSFFPQLVAGPIVRASDFLPQIKNDVFVSREDIGRALFLIIAGLFKKAIIADYISINFIDRVFEWPTRFTGVENLLALYAYAIQLYCDFSGYSDMAIGLALLLGFKLPINFNSPYKAASITEFWQRWHISLSSWLRDYLYIGLGGNRKGGARTYVNLVLTMLLGGLWHGASWRMVIWGFIQGAALAIERKLGIKKWTEKSKLNRFIGFLVTFNLFTFTLLFFRAQSHQVALEMVSQMWNYFNPEVFFQFIEGYPLVFILIVIGYLTHFTPAKWEEIAQKFITNLPFIGKAILLAFVIWMVAQFKSADIQPFIYFQF